jgi:CheY-like chemotaxis protein
VPRDFFRPGETLSAAAGFGRNEVREGVVVIKSRSVLIVEDEWLVRLELTSAFEDAGFAVTESGSAEEALDILRTRPVALLLTDIRLDGQMNGWDLAEEARTQWPDISVI